MYKREAVSDHGDEGRRHDIRELWGFFQAFGPGASEGLKHGRSDVVGMFALDGVDAERNDIVGACGIDLDQAIADPRTVEGTVRDEMSE